MNNALINTWKALILTCDFYADTVLDMCSFKQQWPVFDFLILHINITFICTQPY